MTVSFLIFTKHVLVLLFIFFFFIAASPTSPNYSMSSSSWIWTSPSFLKAARSPVTTKEEFINDEHSLTQYIHDFEEHEKKASVSMSVEQPSNFMSFWNNSGSRNVNEVSPLLRRCTYQLASLNPGM